MLPFLIEVHGNEGVNVNVSVTFAFEARKNSINEGIGLPNLAPGLLARILASYIRLTSGKPK